MADAQFEVVLTVPVRDGQYHLRSAPGVENMWPGTRDGVFVGEDNWVAVLCGTNWGPLQLTVRQYPEPPATIEHGWDMTAERTLDCSDGYIGIHDTYNNVEVADLDVPEGWIRLRLSVRGRRAASEIPEQQQQPAEQHLLELWPVSHYLDPTTVQGPDDYARFLT